MAPFSSVIALTGLVTIASVATVDDPRQRSLLTGSNRMVVIEPVTIWLDQSRVSITITARGDFLEGRSTISSSGITFDAKAPAAPVSSATITMTSTTTSTSGSSEAPVQTPSLSSAPMVTTSWTPATTSSTFSDSQEQFDSTSSMATATATVSSPASTVSTVASVSADVDPGAIAASVTNSCEGPNAACVGDITYYDGGVGACGWNVNTTSDIQIALPFEFMGAQSNDNPYCGRNLTIKNPNTGTTIQANVGDKCMGCSGRSIDLTRAAFSAVGNGCDGRCPGFMWWFS